MDKERIVTFVADIDEHTYIVEHEDGRLERVKDQTDWARLDALTEDEIEAAARADPEWEGLLDLDWSQVEIIRPVRKQPISIRLDQDVLDFFRRDGAGYQKRINAVLRSYMTAAAQAGTPGEVAKRGRKIG